jgi:hypothetical protein
MPTPDLTYLRRLLGDSWIDAEVLTDKPTHLLGRWEKKDPNNIWLKYTETLVKGILTGKNITFDSEVLASKLKSKTDFVSTLAEMESASFLAEQGFKVTLEPMAPKKGPDLRADWEEVPYFVEVRTVGFSEDEDRRDSVTNDIFTKLSKVPSSYYVTLTVGEEYRAGSPALKDAIDAVLTSLDVATERGMKEGTLYHAAKNQGVLVFPGASLAEKHSDIIHRANFIARFDHLGEDLSGTPASFLQPLKHPPKPVKDHERLRKILDDKRDQLPKASRGIILLEVSELFMLSEFSIESALYGDLLVEFPRIRGPQEAVGELSTRRNSRGFFGKTSRVSAVVIQKRKVEDAQVKNEWQVYPTNRANDDTISFSLEELERFGNVGDRKHLSAENAPASKNMPPAIA